jgi:transposase
MIKKEKLELGIFNNVRNLLNQELDLMLFDTTSVSYWGEGEECPDLLKFGYSKDKRDDLKQLIVGLLMTGNGIPVAHEVYPGNQVDVKTFPKVISKVKDKFNLNRIVWVCDRGMISEANIQILEGIKHEYIIGVKMRMLNSAQKQVLLNRPFKEFKKIHNNLYVSEVETEGRKYIVCYNPEQAEKDAINREYFKRVVQDKVLHSTDKSWLVKNGFKKYLKLKEDIIEAIDYDRLEKEKIYDGKWVLLTNTKLEYTEIAKYYKSLWQIENAFSELKSSLDVKPMYHWTERRIRGHIFICFLALVLELGLRKKLGKVSYSIVMSDLKKLHAVLNRIKDKEIIKTTEPVGTIAFAFNALQLQLPGITNCRP